MKPNIKDISDMNFFLGIRMIFHPAMSSRKTPAAYKIMFRRRGGGGGGIVLGMYWWNFYPVIAHGIATECGAL